MPRLALVLTVIAVLIVPASAQAVYKDFRMPSGNVGCGFTDDPKPYLRCDILQSSDKPRQPASCDLDYGHAYAMNKKGRSRVLCAGDTVVNQKAKVLHYGKVKRIGPFTCQSQTTGLTCRNKSDHGFFLSREDIRRF